MASVSVPVALARLPGNAKLWLEDVDLRGEEHRRDALMRFFNGISDALSLGRATGVALRREPGNAFDPHAIAVDGWYETGRGRQVDHIGYLARKLAWRIFKEFDADPPPLLAALKTIQVGADSDYGEINVVLDLYAVWDDEDD